MAKFKPGGPAFTQNAKSGIRAGRQNRPALCFNVKLFEFDRSASAFKFGLDFLGIRLGNTFLDRLGSTFNQILGFFQAKTGDGANFLDHVDLLLAIGHQNHRKLGLFFDHGAVAARADPEGPEPPRQMPAWGEILSDEEENAILAYLIGLYDWEDEGDVDEELDEGADPYADDDDEADPDDVEADLDTILKVRIAANDDEENEDLSGYILSDILEPEPATNGLTTGDKEPEPSKT